METNDNDIELIERFFDGDLSEQERTHFEQRLLSDPEFLKRYQFRVKLAKKWRQAFAYQSEKERIGQVIQSEKKRLKQKTFYWIAAVLFIGIIIPVAIFNFPKNRNQEVARAKEVQLKMNIPEYDASIRYFDENYKQELPLDKQIFKYGKSICFKWNSDLDVKTAIVIKKAGTDSISWRVPMLSRLKEYELDKTLSQGEYFWEMEGFTGKKYFKIE